jgi:nucleoside-diphosphate-sugar epimerase
MVLVTGGSGFLGSHLVRHLSGQGVRTRALYNNHPPSGELAQLANIEWVKCDLLDIFDVEEAMRGIDDIYHCAAMVSFDPKERGKMLHFNPESTANIVNQAIIQGIRKMVHVSSVAALGRTANTNKEINEDQEWAESKYNSAYGISKYLAENEVWRGVGEGLSAVIINPSLILGSGDWDKSSPQLMSVANKEFPFYTKGMNGWVDVDDVVKIMLLLMGADVEGERYVVSMGNFEYREVFNLMAKTLGKKPPHIYAGPFLTGIIWRINRVYSLLTGKVPTITRETANNAHSLSYYNNGKLLAAFPHFKYMPIEACLQKMAAAFKLSQH